MSRIEQDCQGPLQEGTDALLTLVALNRAHKPSLRVASIALSPAFTDISRCI